MVFARKGFAQKRRFIRLGKCKHGNCMILHADIGFEPSQEHAVWYIEPGRQPLRRSNLDFSPAMCELSRLLWFQKWLSPSHARPFSLRRVHGITICERIISFLFFRIVIIGMPYPTLPV